MLKTAIPTLEINATGTNLTLVKTIFITIRQKDSIMVKSNDSIIIDNSVISVALTQAESEKFKRGDSSISVKAVGYNNEPYNIWVSWVKPGSRTSFSGGESTEQPEQPDEPIIPPQEEEEVKQLINMSYTGSAAQRYGANYNFYFDDFDINKLTKFTIDKMSMKGNLAATFTVTNATTNFVRAGILYKNAYGLEKQKQLTAKASWSTAQTTLLDIENQEYDLQSLSQEIGEEVTALSGIYIALDSAGATNANIFKLTEVIAKASVQYNIS